MHICVIPAKGTSERVNFKNTRIIDGKPIICHVISKLIELKIFDKIIVSTDSDMIGEVVKNENVSLFRRNLGENATVSEVLIEVYSSYKLEGCQIDFISCCYPTSLLVESKYIIECCNNVIHNYCSSSLLIKRYSHPIERRLRLDSNNIVNFVNPEFIKSRTQDFQTTYFDSGQFYCINSEKLIESNAVFMSETVGVIEDLLDSVDVDTEEDWSVLERLYAFKTSK